MSLKATRFPSPLDAADSFFRRADTPLAYAIRAVSASSGRAYTHSAVKRALDIGVSLPLSLAALPAIALFAALNKLLAPSHRAFFIQERVGHGGLLRVVKLRSMTPLRMQDRLHTVALGRRYSAAAAMHRLLRRHFLDELPQLFQVLSGRLSMVGIRILPVNVYEKLGTVWSPSRFGRWRRIYADTPLGLTGLHQVSRLSGKEDERRFHRDAFYAENASLGLDLYLLWRTLRSTDS